MDPNFKQFTFKRHRQTSEQMFSIWHDMGGIWWSVYENLRKDTRPRRVQQEFLPEPMSTLRQEGPAGDALWGDGLSRQQEQQVQRRGQEEMC